LQNTSQNKKPVTVSSKSLFSRRTNEWATPQILFDKLNEEFNFDLDVSATPSNAKCARYFTIKQNGLKQSWNNHTKTKAVFCNPPFQNQTAKWLQKAFAESKKGCTVVVLIPFRSDTKYIHEFVLNKATEIRLIKGRLKYNDGDGSAPFPSSIIIFRPNEHKTKWISVDKEGEQLGAIIKTKPEITFNTNRVHPNGKKAPDGIEIRFGSVRPTESVRELLKANGYRFSEKQKIWYAINTPKSKAFADKLNEEEVEADDTQYEKKHFWVRVKGINEYNKLSNYTEFSVKGEQPRFFFNKGLLQKVFPSIQSLIKSEGLYFKKFYNKIVGENEEHSEGENEEENNEATKNKRSSDTNSGQQQIAERLKNIGEGMQKQIDAKINSATSKQRPTAKRMRVAAGMREEGYRLQDIQSILFSLSEAHRQGKINNYRFLKNIRTKAQAELINLYAGYIKQSWSNESIQRQFNHYQSQLESLGIESVSDWSLAHSQKGELLNEFSRFKRKEATDTERKIKELEQQLFNRKIDGFFPTPKKLIERLLELAELESDHEILEPSAGKGDIADAIRESFNGEDISLSVCEINPTLREILALKNHTIIESNFLNVAKKFDRIIMNPPFENGLDIDHVQHAFSLLKPTGRVVAIMSEGVFYRQFKKDTAFRNLLNENHAVVSEAIKDAFKNGFVSTGVSVRIIAMNKDGTPIELGSKGNKRKTVSNDDTELLELEAQAEVELLKIQVELARKRKSTLDGVDYVDPVKLKLFRQKAWALQSSLGMLNYR
jgi:phage N-6-adenine-methyltransferase